MTQKPEILAPAGDFSRVKVAMTYGADAVYVGAPWHGLRQGTDNLTFEELDKAVRFAENRGKKFYIAFNAMPHNDELNSVTKFLKRLEEIQPHALIISDPGVFSLARKQTSIPLHISTQASVLNRYHADLWHKAGAKRIILGRELSLSEIAIIRSRIPIEIEIFIHGSMCVSYSGKCTISNYTAGRDSNRGGCIYSCRYSYTLQDERGEEDSNEWHIMNSKDLMGVAYMPDILKAGVHSLKIEGRMKSAFYVAQTCMIYRRAVDLCWELYQTNRLHEWNKDDLEKQLRILHNRSFGEEFLQKEYWKNSVSHSKHSFQNEWQYVGTIKKKKALKTALLEVRFPFKRGDELFLLRSDGSQSRVNMAHIKDIQGQDILDVKVHSLVQIPVHCSEGSVCVMKKVI